MSSRKYYTVDGQQYSKTGLQKEWRTRCNKYGAPAKPELTQRRAHDRSRSRVDVTQPDKNWFIEAAYVSVTHRGLLFGGTSLKECMSKTDVFVDRVARAFNVNGKVKGRRLPKSVNKHMLRQRCLFFESVDEPTHCRSASNTLGNSWKARATLNVLGWLRQAINCQIQSYRKLRKTQAQRTNIQHRKPYNCDLCGKTCRQKESHIDHGVDEFSFKHIVLAFETEVVGRPLTATDLSDDLRRKWQRYHREHASLSLTCASCNLRNK